MTALASIIKSGHRKFIAISMASGLALSGTLVWSASNAAFTAMTENPGNNWTTGEVLLTDDDGGAAMFDLSSGSNLVTPGDSGSHCIKVEYDGSTPTTVKLWADAVTNPDVDPGAPVKPLGDYIQLTVEQGTAAVFADGSCGAFDPNPSGAGGADGAVFVGTLTSFFATHATAGTGDVAAVPWTPSAPNTTAVYKFSWTTDFDGDATIDAVDLPDTTAVQNKTLLCTFKWTAAST